MRPLFVTQQQSTFRYTQRERSVNFGIIHGCTIARCGQKIKSRSTNTHTESERGESILAGAARGMSNGSSSRVVCAFTRRDGIDVALDPKDRPNGSNTLRARPNAGATASSCFLGPSMATLIIKNIPHTHTHKHRNTYRHTLHTKSGVELEEQFRAESQSRLEERESRARTKSSAGVLRAFPVEASRDALCTASAKRTTERRRRLFVNLEYIALTLYIIYENIMMLMVVKHWR